MAHNATPRTTLADVAEHAGVSATTASYILNGRGSQMRIKPATEERVRAAAAALHYRPNRSARTLRTSRSATIGLISDHIAGNHASGSLLTGANDTASELNHLMVIGESGGDRVRETRLIQAMIDAGVDGMVYATLGASQVRVPGSLTGIRTVLLNCEDELADVPSVIPDDFGGGRTAARCLLDAGIREGIHIVGANPEMTQTAGPRRAAGIEMELAASGSRAAGVVPCDWSVAGAFEAVSAWLIAGGAPQGLICMNDRVGLGAYEALAEHGLRVPDDVSVVAFDGAELAGWLRPSLATVAIPFHQLGATAVRLLLDPEPPHGLTTLPMSLQTGASVRRPPAPIPNGAAGLGRMGRC